MSAIYRLAGKCDVCGYVGRVYRTRHGWQCARCVTARDIKADDRKSDRKR